MTPRQIAERAAVTLALENAAKERETARRELAEAVQLLKLSIDQAGCDQGLVKMRIAKIEKLLGP